MICVSTLNGTCVSTMSPGVAAGLAVVPHVLDKQYYSASVAVSEIDTDASLTSESEVSMSVTPVDLVRTVSLLL